VKNKLDPKIIWKSLKYAAHTNVVIPDTILPNDETIHWDLNILNELNKHFISILNIINRSHREVFDIAEYVK